MRTSQYEALKKIFKHNKFEKMYLINNLLILNKYLKILLVFLYHFIKNKIIKKIFVSFLFCGNKNVLCNCINYECLLFVLICL